MPERKYTIHWDGIYSGIEITKEGGEKKTFAQCKTELRQFFLDRISDSEAFLRALRKAREKDIK